MSSMRLGFFLEKLSITCFWSMKMSLCMYSNDKPHRRSWLIVDRKYVFKFLSLLNERSHSQDVTGRVALIFKSVYVC